MSISLSTFNKLTGEDKRLAIEEGERKIVGTSIPLSKSHNKTNQEPVDSLIADSAIKIFSYLNGAGLAACCLVSKEWIGFVKEDQDNSLWKAIISREIGFGKEKWTKYFGDVGIEPPLPKNICEILRSSCPVFPEEMLAKTHMLVLIPEKVNGMPLTLNSLEELVRNPKQGNKASYNNFCWSRIFEELGNKPVDKSCWVLMTKNVYALQMSREVDKVAVVAALAEKTKVDYQIPKVIEAVVCIFMKHVDTGTHLFNRDPVTYTQCQERVEDYPIVVGGFSLYGLIVDTDNGLKNSGAAVLRRF